MPVSGYQNAIQNLTTPPGNPTNAYVLPALCGEIIYIPLSKSATRLLVTGKETANAFCVVGSGGTQGDPIGFHYHREAHDVFLCLKGQVNVWAGDQARTLGPGDFASVPPTVVHQYQVIGPYSEFVGLIVPGGWEEFFRFIGEPYGGPLFPINDNRNIFEVLIPKLQAATLEHDVVPLPHHPSFDPQPWPKDGDSELPGATEPYFIRNGAGNQYLAAGGILITGRHITLQQWTPKAPSALEFKSIHHCFQVTDGTIEFAIKGSAPGTARLSGGETIYIPAGTPFEFRFESKYAKAYVFCNGGGLVELLSKIGSNYLPSILPEAEIEWDESQLEELQADLGYRWM